MESDKIDTERDGADPATVDIEVLEESPAARPCINPNCHAPGMSCALGEFSHQECEKWNEKTTELAESAESETSDQPFPWSGRAMGHVDIGFVSGARASNFVGIVGAPDAGKTTLLALLYRYLSHGKRLAEHSFSGSFTLQGWENIAGWLELRHDGAVQFPPHTSRQGRFPGLLHLRTTGESGKIRDSLFADAPGEWFSIWNRTPGLQEADPARWIFEQSNRLLLVADRHALGKGGGGPARRDLKQFMRRLKEAGLTHRTALVWTKSDLPLDKGIEAEIQARFDDLFLGQPTFWVGLGTGENGNENQSFEQIDTVFSWATAPASIRGSAPLTPPLSNDPFLSFRERGA